MASTDQPDLAFEEALGAAQGVVSYSNMDDSYFSGQRRYTSGISTGYKYQCVEYARRYMLLRYHCIFGECGPSAEIFDMTEVTQVETGAKYKLVACKRGETTVKPRVGMLLLYPLTDKLAVGHIAVISHVDDTHVGIAEQNIESKAWLGKPYGRLEVLREVRKDDDTVTYELEESSADMDPCLGWMYIEGPEGEPLEPLLPLDAQCRTEEALAMLSTAAREERVYPAAKPLPELVVEAKDEVISAAIARFAFKPRVPTDPAFEDEVLARIVKDYVALLENHATSGPLRGTHHDREDAQAHPLRFRRSAVRRLPVWHSDYAPNEKLLVKSISEVTAAIRTTLQGATDILSPSLADDTRAEALATAYGVSAANVKTAARQLQDAAANPSAALVTGSNLLGGVGLFFDHAKQSYELHHTELDSLNLLVDAGALHDEAAKDAGLVHGFRDTGFGQSFHRALVAHQRYRLAVPTADSPLLFLDLGSAVELRDRHGVALSPADAYQYDVERSNHLFLAHYLRRFLATKRKAVEMGELSERSCPRWTVAIANLFEDGVTVDAARRSVTVQNVQYRAVWKCAPWWALLEAAQVVPLVRQLVDADGAGDVPLVLQPLWTHFVSTPAFLPALSNWAQTESEAIRRNVIDADQWVSLPGQLPVSRKKIPAFCGTTNPSLPFEPETRPPTRELHGGTEATRFYPAMHSLVASAYPATSVSVEGRFCDTTGDATGCELYDVVHPAGSSFMPFVDFESAKLDAPYV